MKKMHYFGGCQHLVHRSAHRSGYLDRLERVTCKTCLKGLIRQINHNANFAHRATDRLLQVRLDNLEAKLAKRGLLTLTLPPVDKNSKT